jgi:predicted dehydrogenase
MSQKIRVAVVGLGVGRGHLEAYAKVKDRFEVVAVCDLDEAKAQATAAEFGVPQATTRLADLLAAQAADLYDLCTPPHTHCPLIEQVLAAGFHVICEKPLVGSLAECDRIEAAQQKAHQTGNATLFPIFQYRFGHGLQKLKHLQRKGFAHTPFLTTIETAWRRDSDYYQVQWRGKWATEMGGCCLTQALHAHDMLTYVNGPVETVFAHLATRVNPIEVEDCAAISVGLENGSLASLSVTLGAAQELSRLRFMFSDLTVESQSPEPYRPGKDPWVFQGKSAAIDAAIAAALTDFVPALESFEGQFALIHDTLTAGAPTPVSLHDARQSLELITAIYYSAETGSAVRLPITADHPRYSRWTPAANGFHKVATHG